MNNSLAIKAITFKNQLKINESNINTYSLKRQNTQ